MPSADGVQKALEQIRKRPANHDYFFSKLTSAEWIAPLQQAGLFSSPPAPIRERDTISFPFWPESQYLARVASTAPVEVAKVMMSIPATDNVRVHEDLALAATKLPGDLAARWAIKEAEWVRQQAYLYFLLPAALGRLIESLAAAGQTHASLELARAVLAVRSVGDTPRHVSGRVDTWNYEQLLQKHYPEVIRRSGRDGLSLLCDLLQSTLNGESDAQEDFSWIWRPAIEAHEQNHDHGDIRDVLINAIRDGSESLANEDAPLETVLQEFLERKPPVFKRIAMHLLEGHSAHPAARRLACDRETFFDDRWRHEHRRLLMAVFPGLSEEEKNTVLKWIDEGPPHHGDDETDEDLRRRRKAYWQAKRLHGLRGMLSPEWDKRYADIINELGEPEHPDFDSYTTTWTGPISPKEASELEAMGAAEIAAFLKTWRPADHWHSPEPEGLGRALQSVVAQRSDRFVAALSSFRDIDPTYSRAVAQGLDEAVKAGKFLEWSAVLDYLAWISVQPRDEVRRRGSHFDFDPHWGWARKAAARLLSTGFEKNAVPFALRQRAWHVIEVITNDPDPTTEDDVRSTMDPATYSINTTRGEAMHSVVRYALWVHRQLVGLDHGQNRSSFDISSIPEVGECLDRHLDPHLDPSPAVRAVFGQWFPWLLLLDSAWIEARMDAIFPADSPALRNAAWRTYLTFCPVYNEPFRVLRNRYSASVDSLVSEEDGDADGPSGERLGEHLMVMLGRGVLAWSSADTLLRRFFENASVSDASHALAFIGRSLRNDTDKVPEEVLDRFRGMWEDLARHVATCTGERKQLLKPFGWWFASSRFDAAWAFSRLRTSIEAAGGIEPDFFVMERLAEIAGQYPAESLEILKALSRRDERGWVLLGSKDSAMTVLEVALKSESTRAEATALIHELGARGHLQFRRLLSGEARA